MKSKMNAILAAVRDEEARTAERYRARDVGGDPRHGADELAHMVRELAALLLDVAPTSWARQDAATDSLSVERLGDAIGYPGRFAPLRWSMPPNDSLICYWVVESLPVRWEDEAGCYAIVRPTWDHEGIVRELLFALRVLAKLAWFRVETAEVSA